MGPILLFADGVPSSIRPSFADRPFLSSIAFSGHKAPGTPDCCGAIVWNKKFDVAGDGSVEYTRANDRAGSRSGANVLALLVRVIGFSDEERSIQARECFENARKFHKMLLETGVPARLNPHSITVWFPRPNIDFGTASSWKTPTRTSSPSRRSRGLCLRLLRTNI
jgi:glutamate/tyrosine decarboxylase-like PLP-dependent enzyme